MNYKIHLIIAIWWTIISFETGRLVGRMNYRAQIKRMQRQLELMIEQLRGEENEQKSNKEKS